MKFYYCFFCLFHRKFWLVDLHACNVYSAMLTRYLLTSGWCVHNHTTIQDHRWLRSANLLPLLWQWTQSSISPLYSLDSITSLNNNNPSWGKWKTSYAWSSYLASLHLKIYEPMIQPMNGPTVQVCGVRLDYNIHFLHGSESKQAGQRRSRRKHVKASHLQGKQFQIKGESFGFNLTIFFSRYMWWWQLVTTCERIA